MSDLWKLAQALHEADRMQGNIPTKWEDGTQMMHEAYYKDASALWWALSKVGLQIRSKDHE